jgi:AmmeMemoRadiSam system protein A
VQSTAVAAGAVEFATDGTDTFSYEGPFGVGYCEALLYSMPTPSTTSSRTPVHSGPPRALVRLAYEAIDRHLRREPLSLPKLAPPWDVARAVFVTLRRRDGTLRGCVGRTEPLTESLAAEVADCAVAAATRDPRMQSVALEELPFLELEVSVLSPPEPVASEAELDPAQFGVVVRAGARRGVLLPAIEGIDRVSDQLTVALNKAGIEPGEPYVLSRFEVERVRMEQADIPS